jgi:hypothetical protein
MRKLSAAHQATVDAKNQAEREQLAYHHIVTAIVRGTGQYGNLVRVGSIYDQGDSLTWQIAFSPRLRDAVIMETFDSRTYGDKTVRCFYLADVAHTYEGRSFESTSLTGKLQKLYFHAVNLQRLELNKL